MIVFILIGLVVFAYYMWGRFILKDPVGNTVGDIIQRLKVKGKRCYFNPFKLSVGRYQSDYNIIYYMILGKGDYRDTDFDGCSMSNSFNFTVEPDEKGVMVMVKK